MNRFFESSFLTWEITSGKNLKFIEDTFEHLNYLEDNERNTWKHTETSDYYFQQKPIGGDRPFSLLNLNISKTEFISILLNYGLAAEEKIVFVENNEMEKYRQQIQNTNCFSNTSYAVFFSLENNIVKFIWFDYEGRLSIESDRLAIGNLLTYFGENYSFFLIDWYEHLVIDLSNKEVTIQYLNDTAENNKTFSKK